MSGWSENWMFWSRVIRDCVREIVSRNVNRSLSLIAASFVACGGHLREIAGNITSPSGLPFNESSYVCNWKLEPPESMIDLANNTGLTMTIKIIGFLSGSNNVQDLMMRSMPRNCLLPQYIELQGKRKDLLSFFLFIDIRKKERKRERERERECMCVYVCINRDRLTLLAEDIIVRVLQISAYCAET